MELNIDPNWLIRMAEKEDSGIVSVGGLVTRIDQRIAGDKANMATPSTAQTMNYTFYWLTGKREVFEGSDPADALNKAGYGSGAVRALDFYAEGDDDRYVWLDGKWHNLEIMAELEPEKLAAIELGSVGGDRP